MKRFILLSFLFVMIFNISANARYYDPQTGRWLSVDPLAGKYPSLSPYNYVANNPLKHIDPDGRKIVYAGTPQQVKKLKGFVANVASTKTGKQLVTHAEGLKQDVVIKFGNIKKRGLTGLTQNKFSVRKDKKSGKVKEVKFKGADVTIDNSRDGNKGTQTTAHELKHVQQGSENPTEYFNDEQTKDGKKENEDEAKQAGKKVVEEYKENEKKDEG